MSDDAIYDQLISEYAGKIHT
ncbi:hypothetical protein [Psychrobacillus sp. FSL K6-2836]